MALLVERLGRHPSALGNEVNPRWVKILPADPDEEGANWKVAQTPTGTLADATNKIVPELQKLYELKNE